LLHPLRPGRPVAPARPAPPGLRALSAPLDRLPRAVHVGPHGGAADVRYGHHLRTGRRRHRGPRARRPLGGLDRGDPARARPAPPPLVPVLSSSSPLGLPTCSRPPRPRPSRRTREAVALVIVHFVESLGGIRAVQAFRREPRNQEIFEVVNDEYRAANLEASR